MDVTTELVGAVHLVRVSGQVDSTTADDFGRQLLALTEIEGARLALDLKGVTYISSAGLRSLLSLVKALKATGGTMVLAEVPPRVREVFDIAGFTGLLTMADTTEAALARLARAQ